MIKCSELTHNASAYLDGDLPRLTRWSIRLHLMMCENCRRFVRQLQLTGDLFRHCDAQRSSDTEQVTPTKADDIVQKVLSSKRSDR